MCIKWETRNYIYIFISKCKQVNKKKRHLVTQTRQAKRHYLHRLFCHIARVPPAAACSHTTTMPLNREVSDRHHRSPLTTLLTTQPPTDPATPKSPCLNFLSIPLALHRLNSVYLTVLVWPLTPCVWQFWNLICNPGNFLSPYFPSCFIISKIFFVSFLYVKTNPSLNKTR